MCHVKWSFHFEKTFIFEFFLQKNLSFAWKWNNYAIKTFSKIFFGVPYLATCIFLIFYYEPELGVQKLILAWRWHHFHLPLDRNWTHYLLIMSPVPYHYTTVLAMMLLKLNFLRITNFVITNPGRLKLTHMVYPNLTLFECSSLQFCQEIGNLVRW